VQAHHFNNHFPGKMDYSVAPLFSFCTHYDYYYYNHFTAPWTFFGTAWVSWYQKGKTNLDLREQEIVSGSGISLGYMQICISPQTDDLTSISPVSFLQAGCPSCRPTNSIKGLKAQALKAPHPGNPGQNPEGCKIVVVVVVKVFVV